MWNGALNPESLTGSSVPTARHSPILCSEKEQTPTLKQANQMSGKDSPASGNAGPDFACPHCSLNSLREFCLWSVSESNPPNKPGLAFLFVVLNCSLACFLTAILKTKVLLSVSILAVLLLLSLGIALGLMLQSLDYRCLKNIY